MEQYRGTTILSVRRGNRVALGGDGQVTLGSHPDTEGMLNALKQQDLREMGLRMYNVFEDLEPVFSDPYPYDSGSDY